MRVERTTAFLVCLALAGSASAQPAAPPEAAPAPAAPANPPAPPLDDGKPVTVKVRDVTFATFGDAMRSVLRAKCLLAFCWTSSDGAVWALEPFVDLPVGRSWAIYPLGSDASSLGSYINSHAFDLQVSAGLRLWLWNDVASVDVHWAKPLLNSADTIRVRGHSVEHSASRVQRPYPGLGLGFFADMVWVAFDYNRLVNGDTDGNRDPAFPRDAVVSDCFSVFFGLAPVTALRTAIGAVIQQKMQPAGEQGGK